MIDNLALAVSHGLMALTVWMLLRRPDLDREDSPRDLESGVAQAQGAAACVT